MTDFERIEQAIAQQELELQRLEAEIQEKRQMISRQKEALSLLEPLLVSLLGQPKVVKLELDPASYKGFGRTFQSGSKMWTTCKRLCGLRYVQSEDECVEFIDGEGFETVRHSGKGSCETNPTVWSFTSLRKLDHDPNHFHFSCFPGSRLYLDARKITAITAKNAVSICLSPFYLNLIANGSRFLSLKRGKGINPIGEQGLTAQEFWRYKNDVPSLPFSFLAVIFGLLSWRKNRERSNADPDWPDDPYWQKHPDERPRK